jgi:hypothetical protein
MPLIVPCPTMEIEKNPVTKLVPQFGAGQVPVMAVVSAVKPKVMVWFVNGVPLRVPLPVPVNV